MELVPRRDAATLLPLIQRYILSGTTIWSHEWTAYNCLAALGYPHQTVNHSQTYVNPLTGVHTNHIESRRNACKAKFKAHFGVQQDFIPTYLDEYMWHRTRQPSMETFSDIVATIARQYPLLTVMTPPSNNWSFSGPPHRHQTQKALFSCQHVDGLQHPSLGCVSPASPCPDSSQWSNCLSRYSTQATTGLRQLTSSQGIQTPV